VTTVANLSSEPATRDLVSGALTVLASTQPGAQGNKISGELTLAPWEAMVLGS
jgi:hypothetical protein